MPRCKDSESSQALETFAILRRGAGVPVLTAEEDARNKGAYRYFQSDTGMQEAFSNLSGQLQKGKLAFRICCPSSLDKSSPPEVTGVRGEHQS